MQSRPASPQSTSGRIGSAPVALLSSYPALHVSCSRDVPSYSEHKTDGEAIVPVQMCSMIFPVYRYGLIRQLLVWPLDMGLRCLFVEAPRYQYVMPLTS